MTNSAQLQHTLQKLEATGCQYAFYFHDYARDSPPVLQYNCQRFSSASIIKVPILLAWLALERQGLVDRAELCDLDGETQVQGAGFSWLLRARQLPYQDVLLMMISLSDNLCTNLIIRRLGLERIQNTLKELGLEGAELQRKLMDYEARSRGLDNWVSIEACQRMYELVRQLEPAQRQFAEDCLFVNQDDALLKRNIPRDTLDFYHKTGSIPKVLHDWGYTRNCNIFLLTQNVAHEPTLFEIFGQLGELMY